MRRATLMNAGSKGVLDASLRERIDLVHYYQGYRVARNCALSLQGGAGRRPGTVLAAGMDLIETHHPRRLRRCLQPVHLTADMVTAPNGGTAANLVGQGLGETDDFVTDDVAGAAFTAAEIDLGEPRTIAAVDVARFACTTGRANQALAVEWYDGAEWLPLDRRVAIRSASSELSLRGACRLATTREVDLSGLEPCDGVTPDVDDRILVKHQYSDPAKNGLYLAKAGTWTRTSDAVTNLGISDFAVYVQEGDTQARSWWRQPEKKRRLNFDPLLFHRIASPERTRRFATAPGLGPQARYLRVVLYGAADTGAFRIGRMRVWSEKRALSPKRPLMWARSADDKCELVLTDRTIDVYQDHRWISSIPVPVDATQVRRVTHAQSLDTLALYHEDIETPVIQRHGSNKEWNAEPAPFSNLPQLTPDTSFSGDMDEVQRVRIGPGLGLGQAFIMWVDDEVTAPVTLTDTATLAADVAAALGALPAFAAPPDVTLVSAAAREIEIRFSGALGARRWAPVLAVILDGPLGPATTIVQRGIDADGEMASRRTGFPRCGLFADARHIVAGFRSAPQTTLPSRSGSPWDFETEATPLTADLAFLDTLDSDQTETIYRLGLGRHILAYTEAGVWFMEARTFDATQPRNWRLAARPGVAASVPVHYLDDAPLYMQSGERRPGTPVGPSRVMRELNIVASVDATYVSDPKNLLAPKLIVDAQDFAVREGRSPEEASQGYVVDASGGIVHLVTQRAQEMVGYVPWDTDGAFHGVGVDVAGNVWTIVERATEVHGADHYLERFDAAAFLDAAVSYAFEAPTTVLSGLAIHEGKSVWAVADGDLYGPFVVAGGEITVPVACTTAQVGLHAPWELEPMPIREKLTEAQPFRPPGRIYEVGLTLTSSGPLSVSANGGPEMPVPVTVLGETQLDGGPFQDGGEMDLPLLERLFTGTVVVTDLYGFSAHPRWRLTQDAPAPVFVNAVRAELAYRG